MGRSMPVASLARFRWAPARRAGPGQGRWPGREGPHVAAIVGRIGAARGKVLRLVARMERKRNPGIAHPHCATLHAGYTRGNLENHSCVTGCPYCDPSLLVRYLPALHLIPIINN